MNGTITKPASPKQLKWLRDLLTQHDYSGFPADWRDYCDYIRRAFEICEGEGYESTSLNTWLVADGRDEVSRAAFDTLLPRLQAAPKKTGASQDDSPMPNETEVPAGRYAIPAEDGAINELAFYQVDRPTEGKWAGKVFVKLLLSDNLHRLPFATQKAVLRKIATVGAAEASAAYGHEFGHCGVCGRGLTKDDSRARGIGPKCVANMGW